MQTRVVLCGAHRWIPWADLPVVENVCLADGMPSKNQHWELCIWQLLRSYLWEMHQDRDRDVPWGGAGNVAPTISPSGHEGGDPEAGD